MIKGHAQVLGSSFPSIIFFYSQTDANLLPSSHFCKIYKESSIDLNLLLTSGTFNEKSTDEKTFIF